LVEGDDIDDPAVPSGGLDIGGDPDASLEGSDEAAVLATAAKWSEKRVRVLENQVKAHREELDRQRQEIRAYVMRIPEVKHNHAIK
jgi:hypothetical protein